MQNIVILILDDELSQNNELLTILFKNQESERKQHSKQLKYKFKHLNKFLSLSTDRPIEEFIYLSPIPDNSDEFLMWKYILHYPPIYPQLSQNLKKNQKFALEAVKYDGLLLEEVPKELQNNYNVVYEAVSENGAALQFASLELRDNFDIVMCAVQSRGKGAENTLYYASDRLKNDKEIVCQALESFAVAYSFASWELRSDFEFAITALSLDNYYRGRKEIKYYMPDGIVEKLGWLLDD